VAAHDRRDHRRTGAPSDERLFLSTSGRGQLHGLTPWPLVDHLDRSSAGVTARR